MLHNDTMHHDIAPVNCGSQISVFSFEDSKPTCYLVHDFLEWITSPHESLIVRPAEPAPNSMFLANTAQAISLDCFQRKRITVSPPPIIVNGAPSTSRGWSRTNRAK